MKKFLALLLAFLTSFSPSVVFAADAIGTVKRAEGRVDFTLEGAPGYTPLVGEDEIPEGAIIRTKSHSKAIIQTKAGDEIRLAENTQVRIQDYDIDAQGKREKATLMVDRGTVRAIVEKSKTGQPNFFINTAFMNGSIKGSDVIVGLKGPAANLVSFEGQFTAQSANFPGQPIVVAPGQTAVLSEVTAPSAPRSFLPIEKKRYESQTTMRAPLTAADLSKAVVTKYSGDVRVKPQGAREWHRAAIGESVGQGTEFETGKNGRLRVVLESGRTVDMKPETHLGIQQFKVDEKTGSREDILVSKRGEIRARIDKLKGDSSFKVVTPYAVAAVRGTILYLNVLPEKVTSYFEQGHGGLQSLLTKVEKAVNAGYYASVNPNGDFEGPSIPGQDLVSQFRSDWDDEDYGYSPTETADIDVPFDELPKDVPLPDDPNLFDDVQQEAGTEGEGSLTPFPYAIWNFVPEEEGGEEFLTSLYSNQYNYNSYGVYPAGEEYGIISGTALPWTSAQDFTVAGNFYLYGENSERDLIWNSPIFTQSEGMSEEGSPITLHSAPGGGAFRGFTGGIWSEGAMDGATAAIFVDPSGNLGVLGGFVSGTFDTDVFEGTFTAAGTLTPQVLGFDDGIDADYFSEFYRFGYLDGEAYGAFGPDADSENYLEAEIGNYFGKTLYIFNPNESNGYRSEPFGAYDFKLNTYNEFYNPEGLPDWSAEVGGEGSFGRYIYTGNSQSYAQDDWGYWMGIAGGQNGWADGEVRGGFFAAYLTNTQMGYMEGPVFGLFNPWEEGESWIAESVGVYVGGLLEMSGSWDYDSLYQLDYDGCYVYLNHIGQEYGLIGAIDAPWKDGTGDFLAMGEFDAEGRGHYIWNTPIFSYDSLNHDESSIDGGAFYGWSAGLWGTDLTGEGDRSGLKGYIAALYLDPNGNGGVLLGSGEGAFSDSLGMWSLAGMLTATQLSSGEELGFDQEDRDNFKDFVEDGKLKGNFAGSFIDEEGGIKGGIEGVRAERYKTYFINDSDNDVSPTWGIYDVMFESGDDGYWCDTDQWQAVYGGTRGTFGYYYEDYEEGEEGDGEKDKGYFIIDLNGSWQDGEITGDASGDYLTRHQMGVFEGKFFGLTDGEGGWIGETIGAYKGQEIGFNGDWGYETRSLYRLDSEYGDTLEKYGEETGWIGAVLSPWNNEDVTTYLAMGEYYVYGEKSSPLLWYTPFQSNNHDEYDSSTFDGGAFFGYTQGRWSDGEMHGSVALLYTDGDGISGVLRGNADGNYYPELDGMWRASGELNVKHSEEVDGIESPDFLYYVETHDMESVKVAGTFDSERERGEYNHFDAVEAVEEYYEEESYYEEVLAYTRFLNPFAGVEGNEGAQEGDTTPAFGIFDLKLEGNGYSRPSEADRWNAVLGGEATFGLFFTEDCEGITSNLDNGIFFARGEGDWENGALTGSFEGSYLTATQYGDIEGDLYGLYYENGFGGSEEYSIYGDFAAEALGSFVGQKLDFAGQTIGVFLDAQGAIDFFGEEGEGEFNFGFLQGGMGGFGNLWDATNQAVPVHFLGTYEGETGQPQLFLNFYVSYNVYNDTLTTFDATEDGGVFLGFSAGRWDGENTAGHTRAFYVDPDGTVGYLSGSLTGDQAALYSGEGEQGMWRLDGSLLAHPMDELEDFEGMGEFDGILDLFNDFDASMVVASTLGNAFGGDPEGDYLALELLALNVQDETEQGGEWGIWLGVLYGEYEDFDSDVLREAVGGEVFDDGGSEDQNTLIMGTVRSDFNGNSSETSQGSVDAEFHGVWVSEESEDEFLTVGTIGGEFAGNYRKEEIGEGQSLTTFEAAGAGQFSEGVEMDPAKVGFDFDELQNFLSVPITETQSGLLNAASGGIQGTMDASFFANQFSSTGGIWAALFNATFDATPGANWSFSGDGITANLTGVQWMAETNQWLADVTGTLPGIPEGFAGQAGGTFTNPLEDAPGIITGAGTGTWGTGPESAE